MVILTNHHTKLFSGRFLCNAKEMQINKRIENRRKCYYQIKIFISKVNISFMVLSFKDEI